MARARLRSPHVDALLAAVRARQRRQLWLEGGMLGALALLGLGLAGGFLVLPVSVLGAQCRLGFERLQLRRAPVRGALPIAQHGQVNEPPGSILALCE